MAPYSKKPTYEICDNDDDDDDDTDFSADFSARKSLGGHAKESVTSPYLKFIN